MHRPTFGIAFLAIIAFGVPRINAQSCGTTITGGVVVNTTWTAAGSPYCITGDVTVSLLTIEPGVIVRLDPGINLDVLSTITAVGTGEEPILFTAANQEPLERWGHITFTDTQPGSEFAHCRFEFAGSSAMVLINSSPTIRDCVFVDNTSPVNGGALEVSLVSGDLTLDRCRIENNVAEMEAGGICAVLESGTLTLRNCVVRNNKIDVSGGASRRGGGLVVTGSSEILDCLFEGNSVTVIGSNGAHGGSIWTNGTCTIRGSTILSGFCTTQSGGFFAQSLGGGIYQSGGLLDIRNSTIACNDLSSFRATKGSGIYIESGDAHIENCTIARNNGAHGLEVIAGSTVVLNSILWDNNAGANNDQIAGTATVTYSDVQNGFPGMGNIAFNPVFAGPGCCVTDLRIIFGSACVDAGDPDMAFDDVCFGPSLGGVRNDMGAHGGPGACPSLAQNADVYAFGLGCQGIVSDPVLGNLNFPVVGGSFELELSGLNPSQPMAIGIIGFSRQCWTGGPLPLDMAILSMTGCELLVSPNRLISIDSVGGVAEWSLPIPSGPALIGLEFYLQGISVDPGSNFIGLTLSNALNCRVGN